MTTTSTTPDRTGEIRIQFTEQLAADFATAKVARAFLRSRGLTVHQFTKSEDGIWAPSADLGVEITAEMLDKRQPKAEVDPAIAEAKAAAKAQRAADREAAAQKKAEAKAQRSQEREAAKAEKAAQKEAEAKAKAEAKAAKEAEEAAAKEAATAQKNLTIEQICPNFGLKLSSLEAGLDGKPAKQADIYELLMGEATFPTQMSVTDRQKLAKKLARNYVTK